MWEVQGREASRRVNQRAVGGHGVRVTGFAHHPSWPAGYVDEITDLIVEKAGFLLQASLFSKHFLSFDWVLDSQVDAEGTRSVINHPCFGGGQLSGGDTETRSYHAVCCRPV